MSRPDNGPTRASFVQEARAASIGWKTNTSSLPDEARAAGDYGTHKSLPFCLPTEYADFNLLTDARKVATTRFAAAGIRWHGDSGKPSNHLLSSQVQCLNALAPLVERPDALAIAFASALPIDEVLPLGAPASDSPHVSSYDATDHVVFEWHGLANHLNEWPSAGPKRGAYVTSADAALRYRATDGSTELALIEWKYTERYPDGALDGGDKKNQTRRARYSDLLESSDGPIDTDQLAIDDLLAEPIYQLARLALLARELERVNELEIDRARVVYAAPTRNAALWASHGTDRFAQIATDHDGRLDEAWSSVLREPDSFSVIDTAQLVSPDAPTSDEFRSRYAHLAA